MGGKFGRLTAYGDGMYGGQFMGGMYCEAFSEKDVLKVIGAGLRCIPEKSYYHECISDVLKWYRENPDDWQKTWHVIEEKWNKNLEYRKFDPDRHTTRNILATINGAYVVMGMLYGKGDPDQTMIISMRCGQDNDCNPSNAAGVLFTTMGLSKVPDKFKSALDRKHKFTNSPYDFPTMVAVCEKLARDAVLKSGGKVEKDADGEEVFVIPVQTPKPSALERCWEPGPTAGSRFTDEEMARIKVQPQLQIK